MRKFVIILFSIFCFFGYLISGVSAISFSKDAVYYSDAFEGQRMANGGIFTQSGRSVALCNVSLDTPVYVSYQNTGTTLLVSDRPNCQKYSNIIDLSRESFTLFAPLSRGRISGVSVTPLGMVSSDFFLSLGIRLDTLPDTFFAGESFRISGTVTDGQKGVLLFLKEKITGKEYTYYQDTILSDGRFVLRGTFPEKSGEYHLVLASGNAFETDKLASIQLVDPKQYRDHPIFPEEDDRIIPKIQRNGDQSYISLGDNIWGSLKLVQSGVSVGLIGREEILINPDTLTPLSEGNVHVTLSGYTLGERGSLDRRSRIASGFSGTLILERIHEPTGASRISFRKSKTMTLARFRTPKDIPIKAQYYLTLPNGDVKAYTFDPKYLSEDPEYLKPGILVNFSLSLDGGTSLLEIMTDRGIAFINVPINTGSIWNILPPDYTRASPVTTAEATAEATAEYTLRRINTLRHSLGRTALKNDEYLSQIAQMKVDDMMARGYVDHKNPDGKYIRAFAQEKGMNYTGSIAENIAYGNLDTRILQDGLEESGGHRYNMVHPLFQKVGFGYGVQDGYTYIVQLFGDT